VEIHLKKVKNFDALLGKQANGNLPIKTFPLSVWVEEMDERDPVLFHVQVPKTLLPELKKVARNAPVQTSTRASGLLNTRAVYGVQPRIEIRANCRMCRFCKATFTDKKGFQVLAAMNDWLAEQYEMKFPLSYKRAMAEVKKTVHADWRWNNTPYLSINCNFNQRIAFHKDSGNLPQALSTVLIVSENTRGGELDLPQLGFSLAQVDGSLTLFRGDALVHGVRPFEKKAADGFRCSIVSYTLKNMKICLSAKEELAHANFLECSKAKARFSAAHKLETLRKAKSFFSKEKYEELLAKWEGLAKAEAEQQT
jgi:hypothetical protein